MHKKRIVRLWQALCGIALVACAAPTATLPPAPTATLTPTIAPTATPLPQPFSAIKLESAAIARNIIGTKAEQTIFIYLPPSYNTSTKHYPVVYFLPGYTDGSMKISLPKDADALIAAGSIQEMILVTVPGGSSFYTNSPITGNWEDFIVQEVVGYVDEHYRTIPTAASRGISGHSMGGFGALNLAMLHPDVFGAVYSISPGLFSETGLADSQMYGDITVKNFLAGQQEVLAKPQAEQLKAISSTVDYFTVAYGMAFAPNPDNYPFYFDYPYTDVNGELIRDDAIWKRWESGFGGIPDELVQYRDNFLKLNGIVVDYAIQDELSWIPRGCIYFDEQLTAAGIPHELTAFDGNHNNKVAERINKFMLPFFSKLLVSE